MNTNEEDRNHFELLQEAFRNGERDTPLGKAVARLKEPFILGDGKKWHYEGLVSMFSAVRQALASLDDSISPDVPPFLLDPAIIAKLFRIPLEEFNWQGSRGEQEVLATLARIESKLERVTEPPKQNDPDYYSIQGAATTTGLSESHIRRAVRSAELPASNLGTSLRPTWRIARKDLADWMEKRKGGRSVPPKSKLKELMQRHLPDLF